MFDSMKQNDRGSGMVYFTSLLVSLIVHAVILCLLVVVPLVFFNMLQAQELLTFLIEPPPPPVQPPPPSPPAKAVAVHRGPTTTGYGIPDKIPKGIPPADDADAAPPIPNLMIPGLAVPGSPQGGMGASIARLLENEPNKVEAPLPPHPKQPIRVGMLEPSKLIYKVNPVYPTIAVKAHVSGTVVLEALVNEEGSVSMVKVLSGHAFLVDAAVQAVKQWKYSPTVLNGEPVPIIATVTVIFRLD
jgi:protein TonB